MPRCTTAGCGYPLRPEGTLWGEPLPRAAVERAWELAAEADAFIVLDSDLRTAPISLLPSVPLTRGVPLVLVGETPTQYDRYARLVIRAPSARADHRRRRPDRARPDERAGGRFRARPARPRSSPGPPRGSGAMMARGLADAGCAVLLAARREERAGAAAEAIDARGGRAVARRADLRDPGHAEDLVARALAAFGRLDGVVLNAGTSTIAAAAERGPGRLRRRAARSTSTAQMALASRGRAADDRRRGAAAG